MLDSAWSGAGMVATTALSSERIGDWPRMQARQQPIPQLPTQQQQAPWHPSSAGEETLATDAIFTKGVVCRAVRRDPMGDAGLMLAVIAST
jgi:hypothetical protein